MDNKGVTIVEIIIYIGLVSATLLAALSFAWTIINGSAKEELLLEVNDNGTFILDKITYHTQRAESIGAETQYGVNPGKLVINFLNNPQIIFDTYQKQVDFGGVGATAVKLRIQTGANPAVDITSDAVTVTDFIITNVSQGGVSAIRINLTLNSINPSGSTVYDAQHSWNTAVTVR